MVKCKYLSVLVDDRTLIEPLTLEDPIIIIIIIWRKEFRQSSTSNLFCIFSVFVGLPPFLTVCCEVLKLQHTYRMMYAGVIVQD